MWLRRFSNKSTAVRNIFITVFLAMGMFVAGLGSAQAQVVHQEFQETVRAKVLEVLAEFDRDIMGTNTTTTVQTLRIEFLDGLKEGTVTTFDNDMVYLEKDDVIFVNRLESIDGYEYILFKDVERRPQLAIIFGVFLALVIIFAGWQGVRALVSLGISLGAIVYLLVPALLAGYSPALASLVISAGILAVILFFTHGIRPHVVIAFAGTVLAVAATCLIAWLSVSWMRLTGFSSDAAVYLNFSTGGTLDFSGLLLGSIIIGLLGVLDDVSITQSSVVHELRRANNNLNWRELYVRAIRVGRDHVGSLVNTLALAYVGAALPLVLLYSRAEASFMLSINQEVIASELVRIIIGSMGLILAVPLTTVIAAWYFRDKQLDEEVHAACGHTHH
ncbi:MAG: YibE/F family protein [Candidatus Paceibacteria bacterium]